MFSCRLDNNNCNCNYYSEYSGLSVGQAKEEDGWRRI